MLIAVVKAAKQQWNADEFAILCHPDAAAIAAEMDFTAIPVWSHRQDLGAMASACHEYCPSHVVVIGADVMDGFYSWQSTYATLVLSDLLAKQGAKVVTTGFSFNAKPAEQLRRAYAQVDERVRFNVRDRVSLKRFKEFTMRDGHLTADVAFLLDPKSFREEPEIKTWADECRGRGVPVVGLNVNPMLAYRASPEVLRHRLAQVALALQEVRRRQPFALLLISHDVRATDADEGCLRKVCEALLSEFGDDVRMAPLGLAADELKSLVRLTDAVVTGRMHLAIAALGVGVPIAGLSYQGKFQGLLDWFDLPHSLIVSPEQMETPETFSEALSKLLSDHQSLKRKVVTRAPEVLSAAKSNLSLQSS